MSGLIGVGNRITDSCAADDGKSIVDIRRIAARTSRTDGHCWMGPSAVRPASDLLLPIQLKYPSWQLKVIRLSRIELVPLTVPCFGTWTSGQRMG